MSNEATIPAGMKPWHGGDAAPADWDGGPVLFRDGTEVDEGQNAGWSWEHGHCGGDIIAYTPAPTQAGDEVGENERDHAWPFYGYAPGHYSAACSHCGRIVDEVDKRATSCLRCAVVVSRHRRQSSASAGVSRPEDVGEAMREAAAQYLDGLAADEDAALPHQRTPDDRALSTPPQAAPVSEAVTRSTDAGALRAFAEAYVAAWEAGTGTVYLIGQARAALRAARSALKGERHGE